jgi:hypothetical protein
LMKEFSILHILLDWWVGNFTGKILKFPTQIYSDIIGNTFFVFNHKENFSFSLKFFSPFFVINMIDRFSLSKMKKRWNNCNRITRKLKINLHENKLN